MMHNIPARWMRTFIAFGLTLALGSLVQPTAAQDGQPAILTYFMEVPEHPSAWGRP